MIYTIFVPSLQHEKVCVINSCCPSRLCMGKIHLKIRLHKKGLDLKKYSIMNMTDMCHEYIYGMCIMSRKGAAF